MTAPAKAAPSKEWCLKMAELEGNSEIGAGSPDHPLRAPAKAAPMREDVTQAIERVQRHIRESEDVYWGGPKVSPSPLSFADLRLILAHTAPPDAAPMRENVTQLVSELRNPWQHNPTTDPRGPLPDWAGVLLSRAAAAIEGDGADHDLIVLLSEVELHLKSVRVFLSTREKIHPIGLDLHDEVLANVTTQLETQRHRLARTASPDAGDEDVERVACAIYNEDSLDGLGESTKSVMMDRARAALAAMREGVDRGMVEVPREPSEAMFKAARKAHTNPHDLLYSDFAEIYRAMIEAAAPEQPR